MTDEDEARAQASIAIDPDSPELTEDDFRRARPFAELFPEMAETLRRSRKDADDPATPTVSLPVDRAVLERFMATGPGWEARMSEALRRAAADLPA